MRTSLPIVWGVARVQALVAHATSSLGIDRLDPVAGSVCATLGGHVEVRMGMGGGWGGKVGRWVFAAVMAMGLMGAQASHPWMVEYKDSTSCTRCHSTAAAEIMATTHWTWSHTNALTGQVLGKNHVINNYCIAVASNEPRCTSCHIGIGYADKTFDFSDPTRVDCLVCHDTTGDYRKFPTAAGAPVTGAPREFPAGSGKYWPPVDLLKVARNVGKTSRDTCGACHFFGGGDDAVKHGDMDSSLYHPSREVDVHMASDGLDFQCSTCHQTTGHHISGTRYAKDHGDDVMCQTCHTAAPHRNTNPTLDSHVARVACQTCHIPAFARGDKATKMVWDWSTAGRKDANGKPFQQRNADGEVIYDSQKGTFVWERNVRPEYVWFNGGSTYATLEDTIEPGATVRINRLHGAAGDPGSKIFPVKRFTAVQPYDAGAGTLAIPHLFPTSATDASAYWKHWNWDLALQSGMEYAGRTYSGTLGWVETEMFWVQNHMVAPKEQALSCTECHTPRGRLDFASLGYQADLAARLQSLAGFEIASVAPVAQPPGLQLGWTSEPGHHYRVQFSIDLRNWSDVPDGVITAGPEPAPVSWLGEYPADGSPRFYRIVRYTP